jgi:hypothetical protein
VNPRKNRYETTAGDGRSDHPLQRLRWMLSRRGLAVQLAAVVPVASVIITFAIVVPVMVVWTVAPRSAPVSFEEPIALIAGPYPTRAFIGWTRPVAIVPLIATPHGIPITIHPKKARAGCGRPNPDNPWWRRRPDSDSNRKIRSKNRAGCEQRNSKKVLFHVFNLALAISSRCATDTYVGFPSLTE